MYVVVLVVLWDAVKANKDYVLLYYCCCFCYHPCYHYWLFSTAPAWVLSGYSIFLPLAKDMFLVFFGGGGVGAFCPRADLLCLCGLTAGRLLILGRGSSKCFQQAGQAAGFLALFLSSNSSIVHSWFWQHCSLLFTCSPSILFYHFTWMDGYRRVDRAQGNRFQFFDSLLCYLSNTTVTSTG